MATPIRPARQTATVRPVRPQPQRAPYQGLFQEAAYEDGQPYVDEDDASEEQSFTAVNG